MMLVGGGGGSGGDDGDAIEMKTMAKSSGKKSTVLLAVLITVRSLCALLVLY